MVKLPQITSKELIDLIWLISKKKKLNCSFRFPFVCSQTCPCCFFSSGLIHKCHTCRYVLQQHLLWYWPWTQQLLQAWRKLPPNTQNAPKTEGSYRYWENTKKNVGEVVNFYICLHLQSAGWAVGPSDSQRGELPPVKGSHDVFILRLLTRWGQIRRGCRRTSKPFDCWDYWDQ